MLGIGEKGLRKGHHQAGQQRGGGPVRWGRLSGVRRAGLQGLPARDLLAGLLTDRLGDIVVHFRPGQIDPALPSRQRFEIGRSLSVPVQKTFDPARVEFSRQGVCLEPCIQVMMNVDLEGPYLLGVGKKGVRGNAAAIRGSRSEDRWCRVPC